MRNLNWGLIAVLAADIAFWFAIGWLVARYVL